MISETTPLNQWPLKDLETLKGIMILMDCYTHHSGKIELSNKLLPVIEIAIKDHIFESNQLAK